MIDPSAGVAERFASDLRELRRDAGNPSYRRLAETAGYSPTTLADAASGRRLPALPVALAYVRACGGEITDWEQRWRAAARQIAKDRYDPTTQPPYRGLAVFEQEDADRFFGREELVAKLVERLAPGRLLVVSGASGSGKSSLVRAGLMPVATATGWLVNMMTPGSHPVKELGTAGPDSARGLLVVDQFEEAFTICGDDDERSEFLHRLVATAAEHCVVLAVRADFLATCAQHPKLAEAMSQGVVMVGVMDTAGLRQAVNGPARQVGLSVERALVARILMDAEGQPGALALISHALLETWRQRQGSVLTLSGYEAAGGVTGAIALTAERVYDGLTDDQRRVARQLLVGLVALGEGTEDTRRRVDRRDLPVEGVDEVIDAFTAARLLVVNERTVELAHEAVIGAWPRLRGWLTEDRDGLRVHRHLTEAAAAWRTLHRDPGSLYRGTRLALAWEWAETRGERSGLSRLETEFLATSHATELAERASTMVQLRRLRKLVTTLVALVIVTAVLGGVALVAWQEAVDQRRQADSSRLAMQAGSIARTDVPRALDLGAEAYRTAQTSEARGALLSLASRRAYAGQLRHTDAVNDVGFSPDGATLATAGVDGNVVLWDVPRRSVRSRLAGHDGGVRSVAFSPDGTRVITGGADGMVIMWDARSGAQIWRVPGEKSLVDEAVFSPDGRVVATIGGDRQLRLWNAQDGAPLGRLSGHGGRQSGLAFTPDGQRLVSAGDDGTVAVWDVATRSRIGTIGSGSPLYTLAISPDGRLVAAAGADRDVAVWNLDTGESVALLRGHTAAVRSVEFLPDGRLASAGNDSLAIVWDIRRGRRVTDLVGSTSSLHGIATNGDGTLIAAASRDRSVLLWDSTILALSAHTGEVMSMAVSDDGETMVSGDAAATALSWPTADRGVAGPPTALVGTAAAVEDLDFAPARRMVAAASDDGTIRLWDPTTPAVAGRVLTGHTDQVRSVNFHPGGRLLASGGADQTVRLWDLETGKAGTVLPQTGVVSRVAYTKDGRTLLAATRDGTITAWDTATQRARFVVKDKAGTLDLALSPDGELVAIGRPDGSIILRDLASGAVRGRLEGHQGPVASVAFSPDGRLLASGGFDGVVALWRVAGRSLWARLAGHRADVLSLAWQPDGEVVYSGSSDHSIIAWQVNPKTAQKIVCSRLASDFPDADRAGCPA